MYSVRTAGGRSARSALVPNGERLESRRRPREDCSGVVRAALWELAPDVAALLSTICACAGIALVVATTDQDFRAAAGELVTPDFAIVDCSSGQAGDLGRCTKALVWTACTVYCVHQRPASLEPLVDAYPGRVRVIPVAQVGIPLLENLRALRAAALDCAANETTPWNGRRPLATGLSRRERQVYALVAARFSNAQIAAQLGLAAPTVKTYVASILRKSGLSRRRELAEVMGPPGSAMQKSRSSRRPATA